MQLEEQVHALVKIKIFADLDRRGMFVSTKV